MANIIKIKRGLSKNLSQANLQEGEMAFTTDTKKLYISNTDEPINNNTTYSLSKSGSTITLTGSDGSKTSVTDADTNTTYNAATTSANGLMTSAMVTKLNGIADGANKYSLPTASASTLGGVKVGTNLTISSGVLSAKDTTYSAATTSAAGLMSAADKTKLDGIAEGANKYTYTLPTASSTLGGVKTTSTVTSTSGLTACPIISGVPYYKDTNTTYTLPNATSSTLGGVKIGSNITISSGTISLTKENVTTALGYTPPTTNTTYSNMTAATSSAAGKAGLVPAPAAGKQVSFLRGDGTWVVPTNTTYSNMTAATSSAAGKAGLVPAPAAGKQASFLRGDGTWVVPTNTTYSAATTSAAGLMSAADKTKLNGIATSANNYSLPAATTSARGGVIVGSNITVSSGTISLTKANVTNALGYTPPTTNTTYSAATTSAAGLMSAADKTKLNGIATGAQVNNVVVSTSQPSSGDVWINPNGQMTNSLSPHIGKHIRVGQSASTSIPNKSTTTITFNTTILNTAGSLLTLTSNGIKIGAGISKVIVNARWTCWGSFARYAYIYVNGNQHTFHMNQTGSTTQDTAFLDVVEGDVIYFKCYQESGSTQTTATSQHQTFMDVMIIG